jgi:ankyrin repeat protein
MERGICHESVELMKSRLEGSTNATDRVTYRLAFGENDLSRAEISRLQGSEQMREALSILAGEDQANRLAYLLELGLNPDSTVPGGAPVIVAATECKNLPAVESLLRSKANVYGHDSQNMDALAMAITEDSKPIVDALIDAGYQVDPMTEQGKLVLRLAKSMHGGVYFDEVSNENARSDDK